MTHNLSLRKRFFGLMFALVTVLTLLPATSANAEESSYSKVSLTNAQAAAYGDTLYTLVGGNYEPVTISTADTGTAYIGNDGNTYTVDELSSEWTDSAGNTWGCVNYSTSVSYDYYVTSTLKTFTRSKSGIYYRYMLDGGSTTSTNRTSASDARSAFVTWVNSTYGSSYVADCRNNGDNYYAAAYIPIVSTQTVTAYTYTYAGGSLTSSGAGTVVDLDLYVYGTGTGSGTVVDSGTFKVASLNVDGLPSSLSLAGGLYNLSMNSDGPGSDGTKMISQYIASSGIDLYSIQEDFDYNVELLSALSGVYTSGTFRGTLTSLASDISILEYLGYLNGSKHIDTDGLNILARSATTSISNESIVAWNTTYGTTSNGNDQLVDKGYRFYNVTINGVTLDVYILHMDAEVDTEDIAARESQMTQLANAIISSNSSNPILVIGDTNCRYTRDHLETLFMDVINAQENLTANDVWVELEYDGVYPVYGTSSLMASELGYQRGEIVDKIIYINNTSSAYTLQATSYTVDTSGYVDSDGTALGDHYPVIAEFYYTDAEEDTHVHTAGDAVVENEVAVTCTAVGSYDLVIYCTECGEEISRETVTVPATGHIESEFVMENEVAATCTEEGAYDSVIYCSICGEELSRETVITSVIDHTAGEAVIENEISTTCTESGSYDSVVYCTVCGSEISRETISVDAVGHTWNEGEVTKEATATEAGEITYTCSVCGEMKIEKIPATGTVCETHSYGKWEGNYSTSIYRICTVCGAQEVVDNPFTDLSDNDFYVPIVWASYYGITTGNTNTTFNPNGSCTRAQIVTFLWRAAGCPEPTTSGNPFSDVNEGSVYYNAIIWAYENGITTGTTSTTFSPDTICNRVQIVTFLWRFAGKPQSASLVLTFSDVTYDSSSDFYKAIGWASENCITGGYSDGTFRPTATCTRAQAVTFLYRYCTEVGISQTARLETVTYSIEDDSVLDDIEDLESLADLEVSLEIDIQEETETESEMPFETELLTDVQETVEIAEEFQTDRVELSSDSNETSDETDEEIISSSDEAFLEDIIIED